jgi:hypothetical protein
MGLPEIADQLGHAALSRPEYDHYRRDKASTTSWRAAALIATGSIDHGAAVISETVDLLDGIDSPRVSDRLRTLVPTLNDHRSVDGVDDALQALGRLWDQPV